MTQLTDVISEYVTSEHFLFADDAVKEHAESLLQTWCDQVETPVTAQTVARSLDIVGGLDLPATVRKTFPDLLRGFLGFASSTGRYPQAADWVESVEAAEAGFADRFREDGRLRGKTFTKPLADVGRNDPCPCGSGKKYKKCCLGLPA